ncbi:hypothetical protein CCP3SC5AM1_2470002 [Gammaproteobacteria bacterium]
MVIASVLTAISVGHSLHYFGISGYIIVILLVTISIYSAVKLDK